MKKTIMIPIEVDAEVFAMDLANNMNYQEAINIIRIIDIQMADWDFTKQLAAFFMSEVLKEADDSDWCGDLLKFISQNLPKTV